MRIALDYTAGIRQGAGIGQYARSLVGAMLVLDTCSQYTLIASGRPTAERPFPTAPNVRSRSILIPDRYLNILWYRWRLPLYANYFTGSQDIYHGLDFVLPPLLGRVRRVVTVHDLAFLEHPETAVPSLAAYLNRVVPQAVAAADVVAAVSQATKQALITQYRTSPEKIAVVPCGVGPQVQRINDPSRLEEIRRKLELAQPFVFCVGTQEPRKNHLGLIKAFAQARKDSAGPAMLAIAGGQGWLYEETKQLVVDLKLTDSVRFLGRVSDSELLALYSLAHVFVFPSFFEGFGIPVLEAMACGVPVITSNTSSLPEVAGDAALLVDPHSVQEIADAIIRVLSEPQLQEELRQKGYVQAQRYTWEQSARKLLGVYQKLYDGNTNVAD